MERQRIGYAGGGLQPDLMFASRSVRINGDLDSDDLGNHRIGVSSEREHFLANLGDFLQDRLIFFSSIMSF